MALLSFNSESFSSDGGHMAHLHVRPQLLELVQPDLLLLGQPVARPLHLHQLEHMHRNGLPISALGSGAWAMHFVPWLTNLSRVQGVATLILETKLKT